MQLLPGPDANLSRTELRAELFVLQRAHPVSLLLFELPSLTVVRERVDS